jgi:hypothetical protein
MSQYPYPPYQQPSGYAYGYPGAYASDYYAPNKRASIMMFLNGGLMLLCGIGCGLVSLMPMDQLLADNLELQQQLASSGASTAILATAFIIVGVIGFVLGIVNIVLGFPVRNGSMTAAVLGAVLGGLVVLGLLLNVLSGVATGGGAQAIVGALMLAIPIVLSAMQVFFCINAARNVTAVNAIQAQYQNQMYAYHQQYYQQHAGYSQQSMPPQTGYGAQSDPHSGLSEGQSGGDADQNVPPGDDGNDPHRRT